MKDIFWAELSKNEKKIGPSAAANDKNNVVSKGIIKKGLFLNILKENINF